MEERKASLRFRVKCRVWTRVVRIFLVFLINNFAMLRLTCQREVCQITIIKYNNWLLLTSLFSVLSSWLSTCLFSKGSVVYLCSIIDSLFLPNKASLPRLQQRYGENWWGFFFISQSCLCPVSRNRFYRFFERFLTFIRVKSWYTAISHVPNARA